MNYRKFAAAAVILLAVAACRNHERTSITGGYGSGVVSGQVFMASTMANGSPEGVEVTVQGTGISTVLGSDGRFAFSGVPDEVTLRFRRASDGIDASVRVSGGAAAVELAATMATAGGRRRSAPVAPLLQFEGTIASTTTDSIVLTTSFKTDQSIKVTTDTTIRKGQTPVALADLKKGDRVHVKTTLKDAVYTATEIIVQDTGEEGTDDPAASVTANGTVTTVGTTDMVVHTSSGKDVTVQVDGSTLIRKYGQIVAFSMIKVGDQVECRGTAVDAQTIKAVQIELQDAPGQHGHAEVSGSVTAVGTSSLTVHASSGDVTVNTDVHTLIKKQGNSIGLSDVHAGDAVAVQGSWVDATTVLATWIDVHGSSGHK